MSTTTLPTISVDGLEVAYSDQGEGPPVLLLHGWPTSSYMWREIGPALAREHRVIAPDLPGFGASSKPVGTRYSFEIFERTLDGLVDELGLEQLGLAVHDTGGPVGVHWAMGRPGAVSRLALLNTLLYPEFHPAVSEFVMTLMDPVRREQVVSPDGLTQVIRIGMANPANLTDETLAAMQAPFGTPEARQALAEAGIGLSPRGFEEIARGLPELEIPVLGLYGTEDRILPDVAETFARIKRDMPHAQIEPLPGVGHFLQEEAPEIVAARLVRFFAA
jgi:pimeloyl-ACP methyl ester carboxylesterase